MATALKDQFRELFHNLDYNQIGKKGCEYLIKANWPILNILDLYKNRIDREGVKQLGKSKWPFLKIIRLGK